ncbi:MAG TPA: hypothetical protein VIH59_20760 [Candidatus Tectomicrobia bacterium]
MLAAIFVYCSGMPDIRVVSYYLALRQRPAGRGVETLRRLGAARQARHTS